MEVLKYLNNLCEQGSSSYTALGMLEEEYGIKFNIWEDLVCLNYCQISSPKYNPITKECRSLVLGITGKDELKRQIGKAGLTNKAFAELIGINPNSVTNFKATGVPSNIAIIAAIIAEMKEHQVEFENIIKKATSFDD